MAGAINTRELFLQVLIVILSLQVNFGSSYQYYSLESSKTCSPTSLKRNSLQLQSSGEWSGLIVQETRYFDYWSGDFDFTCKFKVKGHGNDGVIAVIHKLDLRMNNVTGECIDYLQFQRKDETKTKICGHVHPGDDHVLPLTEGSTAVDFKGELKVDIFVEKLILLPGQSINIEIVFTSFKLCPKKPPKYSSCDNEVCIWNGFFNDGKVNCPFKSCKDEPKCDVTASVAKKDFNYISIILSTMLLVFGIIGLIFAVVFFTRHVLGRRREEQARVVTMQRSSRAGRVDSRVATPSSLPLHQPTAPPPDNSELVETPPPRYDKLFPPEYEGVAGHA